MASMSREQLLQLQKKYGSDQSIATRVGVTRQAIYKLRKQYEISAIQDHHDRRNREIVHLHEAGIAPMKLAVRFKLSLTQIYRIIHPQSATSDSSQSNVFTDRTQLVSKIEELRKKGKRIVTSNGCFDILHAGHVQYLHEASLLGDILIVGINSDRSVRKLKGDSRPIQNEHDRAYIVGALRSVSYTVIFDEDTPCELLEMIRPDIHVKGGDYLPKSLPEAHIVQENGGEIIILSFKDGVSTTKIVERMQK